MNASPFFNSVFVFFLSTIASISSAQNRTASEVISQELTDVPRYEISKNGLKTFTVKMGYGESSITSQLAKFSVIGTTIHSVDLVFTDFPKGKDLTDLNLSRIKEMERFHPVLVQNPLIKWNIIRQTACTSENEARSYFHGIVVYYQESFNSNFVKEAETNLNKYMPVKITKVEAKKILDTMRHRVVADVLDRQANWKNAVLIVDLTSSMIRYNSQVVLWQVLHGDQGMIKEIVMFNDGNSAPTEAKKIGKTGGIYHSKNLSFDSLRSMSLRVCRNGLGNRDFPENDLEAVLVAINKNPNASEYILVADNDAPPRDMKLLDKINKPIRVIICGDDGSIQRKYIEIARKTGGSIHTLSEDINDLIKMREGDVFYIGRQRFKIISGQVQVF